MTGLLRKAVIRVTGLEGRANKIENVRRYYTLEL